MQKDLCFVAMPFWRKESGGRGVDFDAIYSRLLAPAIEAAGLMPLRADQEQSGGIIHKPMFERLILCRYALVDLTFPNPNVYYELGVRHAARPAATVLVMADDVRLPFDVALLRALPYRLGADGCPANVEADREALRSRLAGMANQPGKDSPIYQLLDGVAPMQVPSDKTDTFREQVASTSRTKAVLTEARSLGKAGATKVAEVRAGLGVLGEVESGVLIDVMLSYRAVGDFAGMIEFIGALPEVVRQTVMVREQLGFALNREKRRAEAEQILRQLIEQRGPSSETLGILGRVYKDQWEEASKQGLAVKARGFLQQAIDTYRRGFEADWRDHYPGVNAVTLMELRDPPDPAQAPLLPVVRYSVDRRIATGQPDYWDWATRLELDVLRRDESGAGEALSQALLRVRETWEPETTARNLRLIRDARRRRGEESPWIEAIERELEEEAGRRRGGG